MQKALALRLRKLPNTGAGPLGSYTPRCSPHPPYSSIALLNPSIYHLNTSRKLGVQLFSLHSRQLSRKDGSTPVRAASPKPNSGIKTRRTKYQDRSNHQRSKSLGVNDSRSPNLPRTVQNERQYIQSIVDTLKLPSVEDVPNLPNNILQDPCELMKKAKQYLVNVKEGSAKDGAMHKYIIDVDDLSVGKLYIEGSGPSARAAQIVANLRLLAALHEKNAVSIVFPIKGPQVDQEKNAMLDVYLYAARYQDIPKITIEPVPVTGGGRKKARSRVLEAQIRLPLLDITATGRGTDPKTAYTIAGINTKQKLERLLRDHDLTDRHVKEDEVFGLQSAIDFLQWYKITNRQLNFELKSETGYGGAGVHYSILTMQGSSIEEDREFDIARGLTKKDVESLAQLNAAVTLAREQPDLRTQFFQEYRENNNQVVSPLAPIDMEIAEETIESIRSAIHASKGAAQQFEEDQSANEGTDSFRAIMYHSLPPLLHKNKNEDLKRRQRDYLIRPDLEDLRKTRSGYPMNQHGEEVLETIRKNVYSIIIGATGSGKTTQVPQILLNDAIAKGDGPSCNIICTQPRRIAAKSIAQRVAQERAEPLGNTVGYHIRKESVLPQYGGSINFCTTGILLQQLHYHSDNIMDNVSHIILDEIHERDRIIDFTLTTLKRLVKARIAEGKKVPHITLMSATVDPDLFAGYLSMEDDRGDIIKCPTLTVPGRTFPVKEFHLNEVLHTIQTSSSNSSLPNDPDTTKFIEFEQDFSKKNKIADKEDRKDDETESVAIDWTAERRKALRGPNVNSEEQEQNLVPNALVASTITHIVKHTDQGAILTFLPGLEEISKVNDILRDTKNDGIDFGDETKFKIYLLHSTIADTQKEVFEKVPPGCRKIILATNIAETSITIPDVQHVVDTGKHREIQYDQARRITRLACVWISKSNAKQRAGRAGRVQDGNYYALYSKERYNSFRAVGLPELLRSDLQETCLAVKKQAHGVGVREFLSEAIEPPSIKSVDHALKELTSLQALNEDESLTPLGGLLSQLPVHPSLGKMIVLGIIFRCFDAMLIIGSSFTEGRLFTRPLARRTEAKEASAQFSRSTLSDHIGFLAAVKELRMIDKVRGQRALHDYSLRNYLHIGAYRSIMSNAEAIELLLADRGVIPLTQSINRAQFQFGDARLNENSDKVGLIKALVLAGFYPNLGVRKGRVNFRTKRNGLAMVHPKSINATDFKIKTKDKLPPMDSRTDLLSFSELARSSDGLNLYIRDTTPATPLTTILFSNKLEAKTRTVAQVDGWLPFYIKNPSGIPLLFTLHARLQEVLSSAFQDLAASRSLTDHEERNHFADQLVSVLDSDLRHYGSESRKDGFSANTRGSPLSAFAGSYDTTGKSEQSRKTKSSDPLGFLNAIDGWPSATGSSASQDNPIPQSVFGLLSEKDHDTRPYKTRD